MLRRLETMAHYVSMLCLMAAFLAVGIYWAVGARHFLKWTTAHNESLHRQIDEYIGQPVLATRAQANYAKLQSNGGLTFFTWTIRGIGVCMAGASLFTTAMIIAWFI
jgi:hypothetical protein